MNCSVQRHRLVFGIVVVLLKEAPDAATRVSGSVSKCAILWSSSDTATYSDFRNKVDKGSHRRCLEGLEEFQCIVLFLPPSQLWIQNIEDESTLSG